MNYIHSHDGAADDQLATILLLNMKLDLIAVCVTPADSHYLPAVQMANHIYNGPIIINDNLFKNNFPESWKDETIEICEIMGAGNTEIPLSESNYDECKKLITIILNSEKPIVFIETGTMNLLAKCLMIEPLIVKKIHQIIWTAGSETIAKSPPPGCDGTQTWNCYIDSTAADYVFSNTDTEIVLFTREVTDKIKLTHEFVNALPDTPHGNMFRKVYSYYVDQEFYRLWDVATASYPQTQDLFEFKYLRMNIITTGKSEGKTEITPHGRFVKFLTTVESEKIYDFIINTLK